MTQDTVEGFTGSTFWLHRFMKRKDLIFRQKIKVAQRLPKEFEDKIIEFQRIMIKMRQSRKYEMN